MCARRCLAAVRGRAVPRPVRRAGRVDPHRVAAALRSDRSVGNLSGRFPGSAPRGMATTHPFRDRLQALLADADVRIDGDRDWDMQVHDPHLPARLVAGGSRKLGESYMDGWWDARSPDGLDRKSVVWGKGVSVHVDIGGRRFIKKKKQKKKH